MTDISPRTDLSVTCARLGDRERDALLAISEWCWRRFKLTRPCLAAPDGPSLSIAISSALFAMDGSAPATYPGESRDGLLSLLSEDLPLVSTERDAIRALITAADTATHALPVEHRRELFLLARTSREEGTGRLARDIRNALAFVDGAFLGTVSEIEEICDALARRSASSLSIEALITAVDASLVKQTAAAPIPLKVPDSGHPRPAPRRALRLALTLARDALTSASEEFRSAVQSAVANLLDEPVDADEIEDKPGLARLAEVRQITLALAAPNTLRCVLCEEALSPGESIDGACHDDLAHCVLLDLSRQLQRWAGAHPFDDDQDPARDTTEQRLVRSYHRFAALIGDAADACFMKVSCDVCDTVGYGNARCWSCVAHWRWMAPGLRRKRTSELVARTAGRALGPEDVRSSTDRTGPRTPDRSLGPEDVQASSDRTGPRTPDRSHGPENVLISTDRTGPRSPGAKTSKLAPFLTEEQRARLHYYTHALGKLAAAVNAGLAAFGSGHSGAKRFEVLAGRLLIRFPELESAVAALLLVVEAELTKPGEPL